MGRQLRRNLRARAMQGSNSIEEYDITLDDAIAVVHAAAGLYGTALATSSELRLLAHVNLFRRKL